MVKNIDTLRRMIGEIQQSPGVLPGTKELIGQRCYEAAVQAFYGGSITTDEFSDLVADGTVTPTVGAGSTYKPTDKETHPGGYNLNRSGDGRAYPNRVYSCELISQGVDPLGRGYWPPDDNEPYL